MSWAQSSQTGAGKENTPSPNLTKTLMRYQGLREALNTGSAQQQLFPSDVLKSRLNNVRKSSAETKDDYPHQQAPAKTIDDPPPQHTNMELVHTPRPQVSTQMAPPSHYSQALLEGEGNLSQHPSVKAGSQGTSEFERSSVGTWNSPKEMAPSDSSTEVQGAPLPAPLHVIEAISSMSVTHRRPSFSTASLALSGCPILPDEKENQPVGTTDEWGQVETALHHDELDPNAQALSAEAVKKWDGDKENYPKVLFLTLDRDPRTDDCDINPETGKLIEPVRYIKLQRDGQAKHDWRRMNLSSENHIFREIARREELKNEIERREQEAKYANPTFEEDKVPDAACTLRPVEPEDFQAIADIINLERERGQDSQLYLPKVDRGQIGTLYNACRGKHRPFIVAIASPGRLPNRTNWSKAEEDEYQEFLKFKKSRETSQPTVLGFAVITDARQGFLNGTCRGSRFSGNIKLIVHPKHRKKLIGTALLDKILSCIDIYHRSEIEYNWDCSDTRRTYEYVSAHNLRKYNKVYVEAFSIGENDPKVESIQRLLNKFDFEQVAQFRDAVKHGNNPGVWKSLNVWELEVRPTSEIEESPDDM